MAPARPIYTTQPGSSARKGYTCQTIIKEMHKWGIIRLRVFVCIPGIRSEYIIVACRIWRQDLRVVLLFILFNLRYQLLQHLLNTAQPFSDVGTTRRVPFLGILLAETCCTSSQTACTDRHIFSGKLTFDLSTFACPPLIPVPVENIGDEHTFPTTFGALSYSLSRGLAICTARGTHPVVWLTSTSKRFHLPTRHASSLVPNLTTDRRVDHELAEVGWSRESSNSGNNL